MWDSQSYVWISVLSPAPCDAPDCVEELLGGVAPNFLLNRAGKWLCLVTEKRVDDKASEQSVSPLQTHDIALLKKRFSHITNVLYWNVEFLKWG